MEEMCHVCGEALDEDNVARCLICGQRFHMAWSIHAQIPNCGRAWINPQSCSLGFICQLCHRETPPPEPQGWP